MHGIVLLVTLSRVTKHTMEPRAIGSALEEEMETEAPVLVLEVGNLEEF